MAHEKEKRILQPLATLAILGGGVLLAVLLSRSHGGAEKEVPKKKAPLVTTVPVVMGDVPVVIEANGTVRPHNTVGIVPQVDGRVVKVHPSLRSGGFFLPDDVLVEVDPTDYDIEVRQAEAKIEQQDAALKDAEAAIREFAILLEDVRLDAERLRELFGNNSTTRRELDKAELALQRAEVQHEAAVARRDSARGALGVADAQAATARARLGRTRITLPYAGRVISETVDVAQYVVRGQVLAEVYRADAMEVILPLEDWQLAWFDVGGSRAAVVEIETEFAGAMRQWPGRAVRLEGTVDRRSRMVRVVVDVIEPGSGSGGIMPMPGMFVTARIKGRVMYGVATLPRHSLRTSGTVWTVKDGVLKVVPVEVVRQERKKVFVRGLADDDRIISSALDIMVDGMQVRTRGDAWNAEARLSEEGGVSVEAAEETVPDSRGVAR